MKKIFEKYDLFKLAGIFLLITIVLSWVVSGGSIANGTYTATEINRVGFFDLSTYGLLSFYYFPVVFMFIFVVAGFYKLLGSVKAYQVLTDKIANRWKGKEKIYVAIIALILASIAGVTTEYFVLLTIIPLVITVLSKLKVDKFTGFMTTFGAILVGIIGGTYSSKTVLPIVNGIGSETVKYGYQLIPVIILFVLAYAVLLFVTFRHMSKVNKANEVSYLEDPFASEVKDSKNVKVSTLPLVIVLAIIAILSVLAYVDWTGAFNVKVFSDLHTYIMNATIGGNTIYQYILGGSLQEFGQWDLFSMCGILLVMTLIIKVIYHVSIDKVIEKFGEGIKKVGKGVVVLFVIYAILVLSWFYATTPTISNSIAGKTTNPFTLFVSGFVSSIFTIDIQYTASLIGSLFAKLSDVKLGAFILQTAAGFTSIIAPTSAVLVFGLSLTDVKYKEYLKNGWKFIVGILAIVAIMITVLALV